MEGKKFVKIFLNLKTNTAIFDFEFRAVFMSNVRLEIRF